MGKRDYVPKMSDGNKEGDGLNEQEVGKSGEEEEVAESVEASDVNMEASLNEEKAELVEKSGKDGDDKIEVNKKDIDKVEDKADRPVRERKSVERFGTSFDNDSVKKFQIKKGHGTALKDIPSVADKLSKKNCDDAVKLLHSIMFSRSGKAAELRKNVLRFSGFVWGKNEEKEKIKVTEKFDKCVDKQLVELCDILDISILKSARKEDVIVKLMEFLEAPLVTSEKEQSSKGVKRKRDSKSSISAYTSSKQSSKSIKRRVRASSKGVELKKAAESQSESEDDAMVQGKDDKEIHDLPERSADKMSEQAVSEEGKAKTTEKASSKAKSMVGKESESESNEMKEKACQRKSEEEKREQDFPKKEPSKNEGRNKKKSANKENKGKNVDKGKNKPEDVLPSDDDLKQAIRQILTEPDYGDSFEDILKRLGERFEKNLDQRETAIRQMLFDELGSIL